MKRLIFSFSSLLLAVLFLFLYFLIDYNIVLLVISFVFIILTVIFFMLFLSGNNEKKIRILNDRLEVWNNISYHVNQAGDEAFNKLPIGIVIYDNDFLVTWGNDGAKRIFKSRFLNSYLNDIDKTLYKSINGGKLRFKYVYDSKCYDVIHIPENNLIYMFDETERENLLIKYNNKILTLGIVKIDNLEESLKDYGVHEASIIRGEFLGAISDYMQAYNVFLQNVDDNKFIIICDKHALLRMINNKFDLLNKIREIGVKNHLRTCISLGAACYDVTSDELAQLAQSAVDLAERRGGDQVVINIQDEPIQYFGGNTNALEKNSLVQAKIQAQYLREAIEGSLNVYISGHVNPDVDCIGSMLGVLKMALISQKDAYVVIDSKKMDGVSTKILDLLKENSPELVSRFVTLDNLEIKSNSLLVICDTQSPKIMEYPELVEKIKKRYIIDHHRSGEISFDNTISSYIESYASSTVELVSEMFSFYSKELMFTKLEASLMLAGMVVDTNNFTFRTSARTFEAAAILKQYGADMIIVRKILRENLDTEKYIDAAVLKAETYLKDFSIVMLEDGPIHDRSLLAKVSDRLLTIDGIKASFAIAMLDDGKVGVSARSIDTYSAQLIMEEMGGGGHLNAAAVQLENKSINDVYSELKGILSRENEDNSEVEKMKVILLEDVKSRGKKDDIVDVANGYANYLLTHNLAVEATSENIKEIKVRQEKEKIDAENKVKLLNKLKEEIENKSINVYIQVGQDGKTFGHITTKQISEEFESQTGIHIDKKKITLPSDINFVGIFKAKVDLGKEIEASFDVHVLEK